MDVSRTAPLVGEIWTVCLMTMIPKDSTPRDALTLRTGPSQRHLLVNAHWPEGCLSVPAPQRGPRVNQEGGWPVKWCPETPGLMNKGTPTASQKDPFPMQSKISEISLTFNLLRPLLKSLHSKTIPTCVASAINPTARPHHACRHCPLLVQLARFLRLMTPHSSQISSEDCAP